MNITYACPGCRQPVRQNVAEGDTALVCSHCGGATTIPADAFDQQQLRRCLVCPSTDLFIRKDFPQRLGFGIVAVGFIGSSIAWGFNLLILTYAILFATALFDVLLYLLVPDALMCYRCGAEYRSTVGMERHGAFNLEIHERYRQQAARMAGGGR